MPRRIRTVCRQTQFYRSVAYFCESYVYSFSRPKDVAAAGIGCSADDAGNFINGRGRAAEFGGKK
jgi:hypothetical protein